MGVETALGIGALVASAASAGTSAYNAHKQRGEAKKQAKLQQAEINAQKKQALEERRRKIDAMREGALGMTGGRRTLLSGSEMGVSGGMTGGEYGQKQVLG